MICPTAQEVTTTLQGLGLALTFQMDAVVYPAYSATPDLPAQYHYRDAHGTEVIYLAGHDADTDGFRLPAHASRFWLYPGADWVAYERVGAALAARWHFSWNHADTLLAYTHVA